MEHFDCSVILALSVGGSVSAANVADLGGVCNFERQMDRCEGGGLVSYFSEYFLHCACRVLYP